MNLVLRIASIFGVISACLLGNSADCTARHWSDSEPGRMQRVFEYGPDGRRIGVLEHVMSYRYFLPSGYDPAKEYPMLLFLHGSGERGTDNQRQVSLFLENMINQTDSNYPAVLVAPQLPGDGGWGPWNSQDRTDEMLEKLLSELSIDESRLYVTGLSLGGFGTMSYLQQYHAFEPGTLRFAAAAPAAGAWIDPSAVDSLQDTPIWLAHGSEDNSVDVDNSRETFNVLAGFEPDANISFSQRLAGANFTEVGNVRYSEYQGHGHDAWNPFYDSPEFYEWMFSQSLAPEPTSLATLLVGVGFAMMRRRRWHSAGRAACGEDAAHHREPNTIPQPQRLDHCRGPSEYGV